MNDEGGGNDGGFGSGDLAAGGLGFDVGVGIGPGQNGEDVGVARRKERNHYGSFSGAIIPSEGVSRPAVRQSPQLINLNKVAVRLTR
ncbi:MAG: hypothetical protein DMG38_09735 [Acidobacteria bacterium]|nr:MAG: hypothetical protein DMG38_09735 [Acidobacteriota bacterium]